ncbi:MAG: hypothetical protein NVS4B4_21060 [Bradyrhizobium sp.]
MNFSLGSGLLRLRSRSERYPHAILFLRRVAPNGHRDEPRQIKGGDARRCAFGKRFGGTGLELGNAGVLRVQS